MVATVILVILLLVLALAVIATVFAIYNPDGGIKGWWQESYAAWKSDDLDIDNYEVTVEDEHVDSIFSSFDDVTEQDELLQENTSNLAAARIVRQTSDEVYDAAVKGAHKVQERSQELRSRAADKAAEREVTREHGKTVPGQLA